MPTKKSSLKRARQNETRRKHNTSIHSTLKTFQKKLLEGIAKKDLDDSQNLLKTNMSLLAHSVSKGVNHKKTASRKISRLSKKVYLLSTQLNQ